MGRSKNNRRRNAKRKKAGKQPTGLPTVDDLAARGRRQFQTKMSLYMLNCWKLTHEGSGERLRVSTLYVPSRRVRQTLPWKITQFQVTNVLGTLIDRLADGLRLSACSRGLSAIWPPSGRKNHEISPSWTSECMDSHPAGTARLPHGCSTGHSKQHVRAAKQSMNSLFHVELLNTTLNMCQYSQQIVDHDEVYKNPKYLFQILVHPAGTAGTEVAFFPHSDLAVCRGASLLHTLTEETGAERANAHRTGWCVGKAIVEVVDKIMSHSRSEPKWEPWGYTIAAWWYHQSALALDWCVGKPLLIQRWFFYNAWKGNVHVSKGYWRHLAVSFGGSNYPWSEDQWNASESGQRGEASVPGSKRPGIKNHRPRWRKSKEKLLSFHKFIRRPSGDFEFGHGSIVNFFHNVH